MYRDASGMLLFDVKNRCWSEEMCHICGIRKEQLAKCYESYECVGEVLPEVADELGLPKGREGCGRSQETMRLLR